MKIQQLSFQNEMWDSTVQPTNDINPNIVLSFGNKELLSHRNTFGHLKTTFPEASIITCSTAGEINNNAILDNSIIATAIELEHTKISTIKVNINDFENSLQAGKGLIDKLKVSDLSFVFILSDGQLVNGSDLVTGVNTALNNEVPVAGGLAGDGANFQNTILGLDDDFSEGNIVAIGFYGDRLKIGYGSKGGWGQFGPKRMITKSDKNVLYEIDGENALQLYKRYLGEYAEQLPGSALLFPLAIEIDEKEVVRTILSIDQENSTMTFAGNLPEGSMARLMKANLDNLVHAASDAAEMSKMENEGDQLSILISCVGRKLIFGNRIEEEFDAVRESLGDKSIIAGFYSYGEISPNSDFLKCQLHNQTMTITTLSEV